MHLKWGTDSAIDTDHLIFHLTTPLVGWAHTSIVVAVGID